jgi:hypothetical protein
MYTEDRKSLFKMAIGLCLACILPVYASDDGDQMTEALGDMVPLSDGQLIAESARGSPIVIQNSEANLDASLHDNTVYSSVTGDNVVSNGAFSYASGFSTVIQNSGNHVIIQDATILNVYVDQ